MTTKNSDVLKAFGKDVKEATEKLKAKLEGFLILHPEYAEPGVLHYDADTFVDKSTGERKAWAKFYQVNEVEEPIMNHPQISEPKAKKNNKRKPKVA